jgi:hypothetical protein
MFLVDNAIPFRNGVLIQGHFNVQSPQLVPGEQLLAIKDGKQIGIVRFIGILNANFTHNPTNPRYHISIGFEKNKNYRSLIGSTLSKFPTKSLTI